MIPGFSFARQTSRTLSQSSDPVPLEQDHPGAHASVSALTKEQLRQAMVHLLNVSDLLFDPIDLTNISIHLIIVSCALAGALSQGADNS